MPVVSIHDLGLGQVASDLAVDGSISPAPVGPARCRLGGPRYALLDPALAEWRRRRARLVEPGRILVALGGGRHVLTLGSRLAREILAREPGVRVRIAGGFSGGSARQDGSGCDWITAHQGLGEEFARATVAVVAGGVTLYEACAIGVPAVAVPVTRLQALTTRRVARRGAARDAGLSCLGEAAGRRAARQVMALLSDPNARARLAGAGRALVDARGVFRVADRVLALARRGADRGSHGR
jgi:spore coat polysaccharide biosynthesis predicted glycosyltransferase SpsG